MPTTSTRKLKTRHLSSDIASSFILKSYQLLEDQKFTEIVDWNEDGTAIVIKKPLEFGNTVLPTYFKHGNITSFTRQLNMYNFRKRRNPTYDLVYYHDQFQRGQEHLLKDIKRKKHGNNLSSIQKTLSMLQDRQASQYSEAATDNFEDNEALKNFNSVALEKIASLEKTVEELIAQNKSLQHQARQQSRKEALLVSFMTSVVQKTGTTKEQLYETLETQFRLLPLNLNEDASTLRTEDLSLASRSIGPSMSTGVENYLNLSNYSRSGKLPSCSPESNIGLDHSELDFEGAKHQSDSWRLQSERDVEEDHLIRRRFCMNDDEFGTQRKMVKTDESLNIVRHHSSLDWQLSLDYRQDTKVEESNNDGLGMYSSMNDFLRDGLGF